MPEPVDLVVDPRLARIADLSLARRLPAELAWRFHALPLAEDQGHITVVMANPDDSVAREAVVDVLGAAACVVGGNPRAIDAALAQVWGDPPDRLLNLVECAVVGQVAAEVRDYAQGLGDLLGARVAWLNTTEDARALEEQGGRTKYDLIILGDPADPLLQRLLALPTGGRMAVLSAQHPRWPLKRILLIACGEPSDSAATEWTLRLALRAGGTVTVLAIVPPVSTMYGQIPSMEQGLPALLTSETALGRRMQLVARRLVDEGVEGTLRLRQGPPEWQVRREIMDGQYDLIAVADRPCRWWRRWFEGDLIAALLRWADRPVLIAGSSVARSPITRTPDRAEDAG